MSELDCWLDQIADNPEDTTTRLVFADWLQDHDDPRADAVRASRDAIECMMEFPDVVREVRPTTPLPYSFRDMGVFKSRRTLRPVMRLNNVNTYRTGSLLLTGLEDVSCELVLFHKYEYYTSIAVSSLLLSKGLKMQVDFPGAYGWFMKKDALIAIQSSPPTHILWDAMLTVEK